MVGNKKKSCNLCKNKYEKLFKPAEKCLGTQLSSVIKFIFSEDQFEFPQQFFICTECSLALIQSEIILKRLFEALPNRRNVTNDELKSIPSRAENGDSNNAIDDQETEDLDSSRAQASIANISTVKSNTTEWKFNCTECDYTTSKAKLFKDHLSSQHQLDNRRIYQCMYCPESYLRINGIQNHIAYVHDNKPRPKRQRRKSISNEDQPLLSSTTIDAQPESSTTTTNAISNINVSDKTNGPYRFECGHCNYETERPKLFKKHLLEEHQIDETRIYKCKKCTSTYVRLFALQNHIAYEHENKPRPKPQRRKSVPPNFELSATSDKDVTMEATEGDFRCEKCNYRTDNAKRLKRHMVLLHQIDKINLNENISYEDEDEHVLHTSQSKSRNHLSMNEISTVEWTFHCSYCDFESTKRKLYKAHLKSQHDDADNDIYKCLHCAASYECYNLLQSHVSNKHIIDMTAMGDMPATYADSAHDRVNVQAAKKRKSEVDIIKPNQSARSDTFSQEKLGKKQKIDSGKAEKRQSCVVCSKTYSSMDKLRTHMNKHLGGDEIRNCPNCDGQFRSLEKYEAHLRNEECADTKSSCQYPGCHKRFSKTSKMKQHMQDKHAGCMS